MCAAKHGHLEMVKLLVTEFKAKLDAEDDVIYIAITVFVYDTPHTVWEDGVAIGSTARPRRDDRNPDRLWSRHISL